MLRTIASDALGDIGMKCGKHRFDVTVLRPMSRVFAGIVALCIVSTLFVFTRVLTRVVSEIIIVQYCRSEQRRRLRYGGHSRDLRLFHDGS